MTPRILATTRRLLGVASAVSAAIMALSRKINTAATVIHAWALNASLAVADKKVEKLLTQGRELDAQIGTLKTIRAGIRTAAQEADDIYWAMRNAVRTELDALAA